MVNFFVTLNKNLLDQLKEFVLSHIQIRIRLIQLNVFFSVAFNVLNFSFYSAYMIDNNRLYFYFQSLQIADNIYKMEWMTLDNSIKKGLLIIMKRSVSSIEFTSAVIITMNLDSFISVSITLEII